MTITVSDFGGAGARRYEISNNGGYRLALTDFGATVLGFEVPDAKGQLTDIVLGYDTYEDYVRGGCYLGATIGRFANRIADGTFTLGNRRFELDKNDGGLHMLHGGYSGYDKRLWEGTPDGDSAVRFHLQSPDGDQGFPGSAEIEVRMELTEGGAFVISYKAVSDQATYFNLTNHSYFNLGGCARAGDAYSVREHAFRIDAPYFTPVDDALIPTGEILPRGEIEQALSEHEFDHNFVFEEGRDISSPVAYAHSPQTGISMEVFTDLPAVQFYTGNFLGSEAYGKHGIPAAKCGGFCLETQYFPDTPNHENFPPALFQAGETFESVTKYQIYLVK